MAVASVAATCAAKFAPPLLAAAAAAAAAAAGGAATELGAFALAGAAAAFLSSPPLPPTLPNRLSMALIRSSALAATDAVFVTAGGFATGILCAAFGNPHLQSPNLAAARSTR